MHKHTLQHFQRVASAPSCPCLWAPMWAHTMKTLLSRSHMSTMISGSVALSWIPAHTAISQIAASASRNVRVYSNQFLLVLVARRPTQTTMARLSFPRCYILRWFTCQHMVTCPSTNQSNTTKLRSLPLVSNSKVCHAPWLCASWLECRCRTGKCWQARTRLMLNAAQSNCSTHSTSPTLYH